MGLAARPGGSRASGVVGRQQRRAGTPGPVAVLFRNGSGLRAAPRTTGLRAACGVVMASGSGCIPLGSEDNRLVPVPKVTGRTAPGSRFTRDSEHRRVSFYRHAVSDSAWDDSGSSIGPERSSDGAGGIAREHGHRAGAEAGERQLRLVRPPRGGAQSQGPGQPRDRDDRRFDHALLGFCLEALASRRRTVDRRRRGAGEPRNALPMVRPGARGRWEVRGSRCFDYCPPADP